MNRSVRGLLGVASAATVLVVSAGCAEEQGGLEGARPGPDTVVGGEIDQIELFYDDIVVDAEVLVIDPDGSELPNTTRLDTDISVVVDLERLLSEPGRYEVRHVVDAVDGDREEGAYSFTFDPAAAAPGLVFPPEDEGVPWLGWVVAVVGVLVIAVLGWRLLRSLAAARSRST